MNEKIKQALNTACQEKDHETFHELIKEFTPNEVAGFMYGEESHEDFAFMLWCASETWGFEVTWAYHDSLSEEELQEYIEREGEDALCGFTREFAGRQEITPNKKLKDHEIWGLSDRAAMMGSLRQGKRYGQVLKFPTRNEQ